METNLVLTPTHHKTSNAGFLWQALRNPLNALTDLACEQGDIAHVKIRRRDIFLLSHPEFIEQVLVKQSQNFVKGPALQRARILLGEGLLTSEGPAHLAQRRALQPAFHRQRMEEYTAVMSFCTLNETISWLNGERAEMSARMMRLTLEIALRAFFGSAPEGTTERVSRSMATLMRLFPLAALPLPDSARSWFPNFKRAAADLNTVTEALIANPESRLAKTALINLLKEHSGEPFDAEQLRAHALTFLLAGHETTALLLTWCWDMLAHHPYVQGKLQAEVDAVLGDRSPSPEDLNNLPYTRAVVKETLRMRPPAWTIGRQALTDCEIGGQVIPAGATVLASQWVMHHDPRFYENPQEFRPERWLEPEKILIPRYAFFPFGGGERVCIGEHFAWTEAMVVLALIVRNWQVLPIRPEPARPQPSVTLRPSNGVHLLLERRIK
ncbi:MAG: cytochrome P450 [Chloroflexi bacterium]|nr:cytochrome P450 [Chloroflexota bacterium]